MAEFWPENQSEPSSAKIVKPSSGSPGAAAGSESRPVDPPTVLSSLRPQSSLPAQPLSAAGRELAGEVLAHYRLDDYVGVGGMGAVFRATDIRLDRPVALKILPPEQAKDPEVVARFQHEARAAARLDHENVARVYFVGEDQGLHFIAFEYVAGVNVRELIHECGALPPAEVVNYALQITSALVHAAARGVVHRDVKPSNIIITQSGRAKLVDMGLARNFERRRDGGLTQSGITLGTFDYISPEQAQDPRSADMRSDIYSLGCTLFHMLTGQPPYPEGTVLQKLLKHQGDSPPDPRRMNARVPANLASLIRRMMAKDPARRYQTPEQLLGALLEIAATMGLKSSSLEGLIWVTDQAPRSAIWTTVGVWSAAAAILVLSMFGLYGWPGTRPATPPVAVGSQISEAASQSRRQVPLDTRVGGVPAAGDRANELPELDGSQDFERIPDEPAATTAEQPAEASAADAVMARGELPVITAGSDQDLQAVLDRAPPESVIEIAGTYRPQAFRRVDDTAGIRIEDKRVVIRAAAGAHPRIELAYDDLMDGVADWTLFTLVRSQVTFEGIQFEISADSSRLPMVMFALKSSQVTCRRCGFSQVMRQAPAVPMTRSGESQVWIVHLDSGITTSGKVVASRLTAEECFFAGGDGAFALHGPASLDLRECTLLPYRSTILVHAHGFPQSLVAELSLNNVSVFSSGNPIFDLQFARASVSAREVVFSHEAPIQGTLARVDADSRLEWKGKRNLYHGLRNYLVTRLGGEVVPLATHLADWSELSQEVDEEESVETETSPWLITLAEAAAKSTDDPHVADAFRLAPEPNGTLSRAAGARIVLPWGELYADRSPDVTAVGKSGAAPAPDPTATGVDPYPDRNTAEAKPDRTTKPEPPRTTSELAGTSGSRPAATSDLSPMRIPDMKKILMNPMPSGDTSAAATGPSPDTVADASAGPTASDGPWLVDPHSQTVFHSLAAACAKAEDGAVIEIRYSGELRETPIELGDRHLTIRAGAGFRPVVEFAVDPLGLNGREPRLFDIRGGSLILQDLDLHLRADPAVSASIWSVITSRGADVTLERCTITVESSPDLVTTLVRFLVHEAEDPMLAPMGEPSPVRPQLELRNCFAVGTGSLVRVQPTVRPRLELENCVVEVRDNVLAVAGAADRSAPSVANDLEIHRSTVKSHGGLVVCEGAEARPWLPRIEIKVTDSILVGDAASPWILFRSPRPADELRGLLHWKGLNNTYAELETFWTVHSTASGGDFERYDWSSWLAAPARDEPNLDRSPVDFLEPASAVPVGQRTRRHFQLNTSRAGTGIGPDSGNRGADIQQIPPPPQERAANKP